MRVAFGVQNVFVITDYSGVDPEIPGVNGIDGSIWPLSLIHISAVPPARSSSGG